MYGISINFIDFLYKIIEENKLSLIFLEYGAKVDVTSSAGTLRTMKYNDRIYYFGQTVVIGYLNKGGKWRKRNWYTKWRTMTRTDKFLVIVIILKFKNIKI